MNLDWWTGNIDEASVTDTFDNDDIMNGQAWRDFCDWLRRAGDIVLGADVPATPLDRADGFRHLLALAEIGASQALARSDPLRPTFGQTSRTDVFKWGLDCPDAAYRGTAIRSDLTYRITGSVGTVHYLSFQINQGMRNQGNVRGDQLTVGPDGSFELWLGPEPHPGDCFVVPPGSSSLIVRQFFYDWDREVPASLHIERVDVGAAGAAAAADTAGAADTAAGAAAADTAAAADPATDPDRTTPDRVARQLRSVGSWLHANAEFWADVEVKGQAEFRNAFQAATAKPETGGAEENVNGWGHYDLAPDEALIVEVTPARAHYWSLHLGNFWWESLDYAGHHTSLNGHQAVLDDDGVFRAVIAHHDPGVPNWLDTMGHGKGPMLFRWVLTDSVPEPITTVVPFAEVRSRLPASTPVVDAAMRAAVIERRRAHVLRRFSC